ncbi:DUF1254 domain-containing protein [Chelativorans sp. ZYF759]|nr:DUF1254 domain-containing protein [Chelativorans sp. ZYF759]
MSSSPLFGGWPVTRFAYALLIGVVGAGIVHIAILFLLPYLAERDAWSRMAELGEVHETLMIEGEEANRLLANPDPLFLAAACRFDLDEGPVRIHAPDRVLFWSLSVYDRMGQNIFSLNDRTASEGQLDIVILKPVQMLDLRHAFPEDFATSIFVEADLEAGTAVIRSFLPDESWRSRVGDYLRSVSCDPY